MKVPLLLRQFLAEILGTFLLVIFSGGSVAQALGIVFDYDIFSLIILLFTTHKFFFKYSAAIHLGLLKKSTTNKPG